MTDLVERLRDRDSICMGGLFTAIPLLLEAAALEAKEAEIAALRESIAACAANCNSALSRAVAAEARAETAERKLDDARAALKAFLPDPTMMDILWGDMDDEATGTHTIKLKHFRAARAVIEKK